YGAELSAIDGTDLRKDAVLDRTLLRRVYITLGKPLALIVLASASAGAAGTAPVISRRRIGHLRSGILAGRAAELSTSGLTGPVSNKTAGLCYRLRDQAVAGL